MHSLKINFTSTSFLEQFYQRQSLGKILHFRPNKRNKEQTDALYLQCLKFVLLIVRTRSPSFVLVNVRCVEAF